MDCPIDGHTHELVPVVLHECPTGGGRWLEPEKEEGGDHEERDT